MSYDLQLPKLGSYQSPSNHPYCPSSISSSAASSTSSVFSVESISSQTSSSSSSSTSSTGNSQPTWNSEDVWNCRVQQSQPQSQPQSQTSQSNGCTLTSNVAGLARPYASRCPFSALRDSAVQAAHCLLPPIKQRLTLQTTDVALPAEQRQHPRRCSITQRPPSLVRQSDRKITFVDSLVDTATQMVEVIWPLSVPCHSEGVNGRGVLPLRMFIQETLRRSRTSYSTLQVALYYLILIKPYVRHDFTMEQPEDTPSIRALQCGRRMFLAALILASKYLQDRNYSARAWSKISGLKVNEINTNEMAFLKAVNWKLHITESVFDRWQQIVLDYTPQTQPPPSPDGPNSRFAITQWKAIVLRLTPELDTIELKPKSPTRVQRPELRVPTRPPLSVNTSLPQGPSSSMQQPPRFLEPRPEMVSPVPSLSRMGPLPTPQLTPQSNASTTPAVSAGIFVRRPSIVSAMAQAQSVGFARSALDQWNPVMKHNGLEAYQLHGRRGSVAASSVSSSSSPESMISDNSSRSSRASSISSVSSAWAPCRAKLARLATCRNARLQYPVTQKPKETFEFVTSEPMSSPDLESFHIDDINRVTPSVPSSGSLCDFNGAPLSACSSDFDIHAQFPLPLRTRTFDESDVRETPTTQEEALRRRKRGRSSAGLSLQREVARALKAMPTPILREEAVLPDPKVARSFLLDALDGRTPLSSNGAKALQSPMKSSVERLPIQKDQGRKRACCASEVVRLPHRQGPGMWEGVL